MLEDIKPDITVAELKHLFYTDDEVYKSMITLMRELKVKKGGEIIENLRTANYPQAVKLMVCYLVGHVKGTSEAHDTLKDLLKTQEES